MLSKSTPASLVLAAMVGLYAQLASADVIYNFGSPRRPVGFSNLLINGSLYDAIVTYNHNAAANPLRIGELPDADIDAALSTMVADLNDEGVDSSTTIIRLQPNTDTIPLSPLDFQISGFIADFGSSAVDTWTMYPGVNKGLGLNNQFSFIGFVQFTAVPEPCSSMFIGMLALGLVGFRRRKADDS